MRHSYLLVLLGVPILALSVSGCNPAPNLWVEAQPGQKKVLVSFPPLYAMAHAVAGPDAYVLSLLTTQGPHDYEGSQTDFLMVDHADLFIYNGLTLDDQFVKRMLQNHRNSGLQTLDLGGTIQKQNPDLLIKMKPMPGHEGHGHGDRDPHLWLGIPQAVAMTELIADRLGAIDSAHKDGYKKRAGEFIAKLHKLHADGKAVFKGKKNKTLITNHEAFAYFAHEKHGFDLTIAGVIQIKPGLDPDSVNLANLIATCKNKQVAAIAVEPQYSRAQAEALKRTLKKQELDVEIVTLDPLETAPIPEGRKFNPDPDYYLTKMRANIDILAAALR